MKINKYIKAKRKQLGETQAQFGKRFGVSHAAVSDWEAGKSEAPYKVLEYFLSKEVHHITCPACHGSGTLQITKPIWQK